MQLQSTREILNEFTSSSSSCRVEWSNAGAARSTAASGSRDPCLRELLGTDAVGGDAGSAVWPPVAWQMNWLDKDLAPGKIVVQESDWNALKTRDRALNEA